MAAMPLRHLRTEARGTVTVVTVSRDTLEGIGEWNYPNDTVTELLDEFRQAVAAAPAGVVLDVRDTRSLDHARVALLVRLVRVLLDAKRPRVLCCSGSAKEVLDLCRFESLCPCRTELDEAVTEVGA